MKKFKVLNRISRHKIFSSVVVLLVIGSLLIAPFVRALTYQEQINQLENVNANNQNIVSELEDKASSYQDSIDKLKSLITQLQDQIDNNKAKRDALNVEIAKAQMELDRQKRILGDSIRALYVEGQISTFEMLAASKDLSEFVDKQVYRGNVQNKVKESLDKVTALKLELQKNKEKIETLLAEQKIQQDERISAQQKQIKLLSYNQSQRDNYNNKIAINQKKISKLIELQIAANAAFYNGTPGSGPTCGGGYPGIWCNIPMDSVIDSWGMYNRECVSYTAFKVHRDYLLGRNNRDMPYWGGRGNANLWDDNARAAGIPVNTSPQPGAIAVSNSGYYGHVMYVESVNSNGTINISQYNGAWDGRYSTRSGVGTYGLVFIHF